MSDSSPQEPPSRPRPLSSASRGLGGSGRPGLLATAQTLGALALGILLFIVPLYLWRRPRATPPPAPAETALPDAPRDAGVPATEAPIVAAADAGHPSPVRLTDPRVIECHDRGARRTPSDQCDHVVAFEKAFADAIVASYQCVPADAGAGSIEFVADLSFARRRNPVTVALPHGGRSFQSSRIVRDCMVGVRSRLNAVPVAPFTHAHARYKVSLVANYPGPHGA